MSQPRSFATAPPPGTGAAPATAVGSATATLPAPAGAEGQQLVSSPDQQTPGQTQHDTPRQLRLLTTALILVGLLFGVAGAVSFAGLAAALDRAEANTAQLIRVQQIQTNLLSADATATSAFLVGGLEPPAQRSAYDQAVAATGRLIAQASDAQPADAAALSGLNQAVVDYAVSIEQARANNRQGFPVGAAYLRNASSTLRTDALPILDNLVSANSARAADAMDSRIGWLFGIVGLLALAALVTAMVWVARRFKRRINVGLLSAGLLVLLTWVAGVVVLAQVGSQVNGIQQGSFRSVNSAAAARIQANNAKSNESLTLIARGSGAAFEQAWAASAGQVDTRLGSLPGTELTQAWSPYKSTHQQIRKLDDGGSWDAAVALATGSGATSSNALFGRFDAAATTYLDDVSEETSSGLAAPQALLVVLAILTFLAGVGAALLARRGLAERLREYR
jgi:hypothetical protein